MSAVHSSSELTRAVTSSSQGQLEGGATWLRPGQTRPSAVTPQSLYFVSLTLSDCIKHSHVAFGAGMSLSYASAQGEILPNLL